MAGRGRRGSRSGEPGLDGGALDRLPGPAAIQLQLAAPAPVVIAVNGHSSSGKTTLGRRLVASLGSADVLHTDDLAWHQGVFAWDELLVADVLPVVRAGDPLRYRPPQWQARGREGAIELRGGLEFLVVEGVGASRVAPSPADARLRSIWVPETAGLAGGTHRCRPRRAARRGSSG